MKKFLLLSLLAAGFLTANAQNPVTINDFTGYVTSGSFANPPEGWTTHGTGTTFSVSNGVLYGYCYNTDATILITPALTGTVTITGRGEPGYDYGDWGESYDGSVYVYTMTSNGDGTFEQGSTISGASIYETTSTTKEFNVEDGTYIGIELEDAYLESITYTPMPTSGEYTSVKINTLEYTTPGTDCLKGDYENNVEYSLNATVINNGTTALNPGDEGYVFTVYEKSAPDVALGTYTPDVALAPGETKVFTITGTFTIDDIAQGKTVSDNGAYWCCLCVKNGINSSTAQAPWVDIWPNWYLFDTYIGTEIAKSLDFGFVAPGATVTKTIKLRNKCINPLEVNYIQVPEGFTLETEFPFTVNPVDQENHEKELTLTMNADAAGVLAGEMQIYVGGAEMPATVLLTGARPGSDNFYEDFEDDTLAPGWYIEPQLTMTSGATAVMGEGNVKYLDNSSSSTPGSAITPRITAEEGEYFAFQAASRYNSSDDSYVKVYYSTDRSEWTPMMTIVNKSYATADQESFSSSVPGYGSDGTALKLFTMPLPAGEGYLKFEILYAHIDNVFGAHTVTVDHDLMFNKITASANPMVNNPLNVTANIKNLAEAEAAGSYTLTLFANGEPVAEMTETPELPTGDTDVTIGYTPHSAGDVTLKVQLTAGEYTIPSAEIAATVAEESNNAMYTVGTGTLVQSGSSNVTTPIQNYDKNSEAHMIYTAEQLAAAGVTAGTEITGISFFGANTNKPAFGPVTVWMQPTELATLTTDAPPTTTDENKVYYNGNYTYEKCGAQTEAAECLRFDFAEPYVYNGGNLLVSVRKEFNPYITTGTYFVIDESLANQAIIRSSDYSIDDMSYKAVKGLAQLGIYYALEPANYSGTVVTGNDNTPVEGAQIALTSGQVLYSGVSAADGTFSIDVIQGDKDYTVSVTKENFNTYTEDVTFADGNVTATIQLTPVGDVGVEGVNADTLNVRIEADVIYVDGIERANLTIYSANGMAAASARGNSISTADLQGGVYILSVDSELGKANVRFIKR